ncbi:MAG TPA: hypothetical protein VK607_12020 [Kofleriaceae bacterium]|nr:hypothetical protein [Kofleriaceae bacterium]
MYLTVTVPVVGAPPAMRGYNSRMCIICVELAKQSITPSEGRRALREMSVKLDRAHVAEVEAKLKEAETAAAKP